MIDLINAYLPYAMAFFIVLNIILLVVLAFYIRKVNKLRRRFERFMTPNSKNHNIEGMLLENIKLINEIRQENESIKFEQDYINGRLKTCIQHMGIVRYNTFEDVGGDLSYAVALLDEEKNGVVLNSLYYRQGCYTYGKPIIAGESKYQLSEEEQEAINKAIEGIPHKKETNTDKNKLKRKKISFKNRKNKKPEPDAMIVKNSRRSNEAAGA